MDAKRKDRRKRSRPRGPQKPVTLADVDRFLDSPVARRYYAFSDSNVKRQVIRMLLFLREEVHRLGQGGGTAQPGGANGVDARDASGWVQRLGRWPRG